MRKALPAFVTTLLIALAASGQGPAEAPAPSVHYLVRSDPRLEHLDVRVCFEGEAPDALGPGLERAGRAIEGAWDARGHRLPIRGHRVDLSSLPDDACMRYRLDLETARRGSRFSGRFGIDFMSSQGVWLWRDRRRVPRGGATIRFELPDGLSAATPWPSANGVQRLGPSAFRRPGFVAFGRLEPIVVERRHVRATAVRLGEGWQLDDEATRRWLTRAIDGVSTVRGRFPVDELLVLLVPQGGTGLGFGMVRRGGGYSVAFQVGRRSTVADIERGWVAWHELSHLQLPALPQRDAWLYEGLATYYQEVLPGRLGIQSDVETWSELVDGFGRGARQARPRPTARLSARGRTLSDAARTMLQTYAFQRVYWAGTAFVLESDVTLRQRGSSLDAALRSGGRRWRGDLSLWSSERVCAAWDRTLDARVLRPMRERYASSVGFPGTSRLLRRLGVRERGERVELEPAELSSIRDDILSSD